MRLALAGSALCLASCGAGVSGSTGSSTGTNPSAGHGGFSARLNTICGQFNTVASEMSDNAQEGRLLKRYLPRFRSLSPPVVLRPVYSLFVSDLVRESDDLVSNDSVGAQHVIAQTKALAAQLKAPSCAK